MSIPSFPCQFFVVLCLFEYCIKPVSITLQLFVLNSICHLRLHLCILSRSACNALVDLSFVIFLCILASSANMFMYMVTPSVKSFMYIMNMIGACVCVCPC